MRVHHIGYAVADIEKVLPAFEQLGFRKGELVTDVERCIKIMFLQNGNECIELVAPNGEKTPVDGVLKKNGAMPYHVCYEVDDIKGSMQSLKRQGYIMMTKPSPAPAIGGCPVVFLYHKDMGMIELVEMKNTDKEN